MTSLSEAYERQAMEVSRRRLYLGTGLFATGALFLVGGLLAGTTRIAMDFGLGIGETRELAGVLAGLGLPALLLGVFTVLPATSVQRAGAGLGAGIAVVGVAIFRYTYPGRWYVGGGEEIPSTLTLMTTVTYFAGTVITLWFLFTALATFKRRNDPGGTVTLTVQRGGETKTVEVAAKDAAAARESLSSGGGGIGFGGVDASDAVPTQTGSASASDGGTRTNGDISSPSAHAEVMGQEEPSDPESVTDRYCGNCRHFDYVRTDEGIQPYCGAHDELMDDMEACDQWTARTAEDRPTAETD
jgi:hypothetical protein